ncbi:hypothetical protein CSB93_1411 [Pseudomonas paraeruginosa]|uniref:Uncharacterized protein n=1 Tax=Pseudomonas paraeruginosa TaxID=2994495 RepID=A0A2R3J5A0_9PSED|nr:hypothetical protein CSB93_1411 [Pseudomonas paraeruginosa]
MWCFRRRFWRRRAGDRSHGAPSGRNPKKKAAGSSGLEKTSNRSNQGSASGSLSSVCTGHWKPVGTQSDSSMESLFDSSGNYVFHVPLFGWRDRGKQNG